LTSEGEEEDVDDDERFNRSCLQVFLFEALFPVVVVVNHARNWRCSTLFVVLAFGFRRKKKNICLSIYLSTYLCISCCCSWRKKDTLAEFFQVLTGELLTGESIESFIAFVVDAIRKMIYLLERCYYLHSLYFLHVCLSIKDRLLANFRSQTDRRS
jgi:hypothetical protein